MRTEILHQRIEIHLSQYHCFFVPDNLIFSSTDAFYELAALVLHFHYYADIQELCHEIYDINSYHDS